MSPRRPAWPWLVAAASLGCSRDVPPPATTVASPVPAPVVPSIPEPPATIVPPRFVDVAGETGIDFAPFDDASAGHLMIVETMGSGAGWLDYDLDGWLDLYLTEGCRLEEACRGDGIHRDRLYRGRGGAGFRDVSTIAGVLDDRFGQGIAVGDFDVDGFPDVYLSNYRSAILLRNNGDGTFVDVTEEAGIASDAWGSSAIFTDLDRDGVLDIFACRYLHDVLGEHEPCDYAWGRSHCGPAVRHGVPDLVWIGRGDGTFVESAAALGIVDEEGKSKGLAVSSVDLDDDLVPELYVGNDAQPNSLWRWSPGPPASYTDVAPIAGCAVSGDGRGEATMGIATEDFDGDGLVDIHLTHFALAKNTLYRNLGGLTFEDASAATGIAAVSFETLAFGTVALDWDRDGRMDLFNATGHVFGTADASGAMPPQLLRQRDDGLFVDVSAEVRGAYFETLWLGRAAAAADFDEDGDLDIAVTHVGARAALLRDDTAPPGRFIGLDLRTPHRLPPVGGRVEVACGGRRVVRPIATGGSYLSAHDPRLLFSLPPGEEPAVVTLRWPSGRIDRMRLTGDRYWRITEGREPVMSRPAGALVAGQVRPPMP